METDQEFVGIADIIERWTYTRAGVHNVIRWLDFPKPFCTVNKGRVKVWRLSEVQEFEKRHPEVVDPIAKARKQRWYARYMIEGYDPNAPENKKSS